MSRCLATAGFALVAALIAAGPGAAQTISSQRVNELGASVLTLKGEIKQDQIGFLIFEIDKRLREDKAIRPFIALDSPGGALDTAQRLGRYMKARGIGSIVLPSGECYSACTEIFFAGYDAPRRAYRRIAFPGSKVGVHQASLGQKPALKASRKGAGSDGSAAVDPAEVIAAIQSQVGDHMRYLQDMNVSLEIQTLLFTTPPAKMSVVPAATLGRSEVLIPTRDKGRWTIPGLPDAATLFPGPDAPPPPVAQGTVTARVDLVGPEGPPRRR